MKFLVTLLCLMLMPALAMAASFSENFMSYKVNTFAQSSFLTIENTEDKSESKFESESLPSLGVGANFDWVITDRTSFYAGGKLDYIQYEVTNKIDNRVFATFKESMLVLGIPMGFKYRLFKRSQKYFIPIAWVPQYLLSSNTSVTKCEGLCSDKSMIKSSFNSFEVGLSYNLKDEFFLDKMDFSLVYTTALTDQYKGNQTDLRLSGLQLRVGYFW